MTAHLEEQTTSTVVQDIVQTLNLTPYDEAYQAKLSNALTVLLAALCTEYKHQPVDSFLATIIIAEIEQKIIQQVNSILHHPAFQALEASWRSLFLLIQGTQFRENIKIELLNLCQSDLLEDLEDAPEIIKSGLYKLVYGAEYGQYGGEPYGVMIADYQLTPKGPDIKLLQNISNIAAMSHTPFIAAAHNEFFDIERMTELPGVVDLHDIYESPKYQKWKKFRAMENARYVGLVLPRFLLRRSYHSDNEKLMTLGMDFQEVVCDEHEHSLWGNPAFLFAARLLDSFAKYRWCPHIIGPSAGGLVEGLTEDYFESMGRIETKLATEIMITDRREYELTDEGFIALTLRRGNDTAAFYSASSVQSGKHFAYTRAEKETHTNFKLGSQLPYLFIINRIAHYLKVIQRENIGSWKEKADVERGLNQWIKQYVSDQENPSIEIRNRRPLRKAKIEVTPVAGEPGWYRASVSVRPHFKYMGADFTLSLVGKLEVTHDTQQHRLSSLS